MKIMKIFGVVMALHVFALVVIFANPGCSSARSGATARPTPADSISSAPAPLAMPASTSVGRPLADAGLNFTPVAALSFDPNAPAVAEGSRVAPLRPGSQPAAAATRATPAPEATTTVGYTVVAGDSLWKIGQANKITPQELATANHIPVDSALKLGQKLVIPVKAGAAAATKADPAAKGAAALPAPADARGAAAAATAAKKGGTGKAFEYTVQHGETLSSIALKFKVSAANIATENSLPDRNLVREGMVLLIPSDAPAAVSGKSDPKAGATKAGTPSAIETIGPSRPPGEIPTIKIDAVPSAKR